MLVRGSILDVVCDEASSVTRSHPDILEVISLVREFTGLRPDRPITAEARIEADLGITGDDGIDLLRAVEARFDVNLGVADGNLRRVFDLGENEFLFGSEGLEVPFVGRLRKWLTGRPQPVIRDLSVGDLHFAVALSHSTSGGGRPFAGS